MRFQAPAVLHAEGELVGSTYANGPGAASELAKYVPDCLQRMLAEEGLREGPRRQRFEGAVLLTDIVGFSSLTDRFATQGPEGAERLSTLLNAYFGCMTEIALDHGGDVVDFVGDAITVMWPGCEGLQSSVMQAIQCGLALQSAAIRFQQDPDWALRQRVAVAAGELSLFSVGGTRYRWYWMVAGEPTRRAAAAHESARPGEVIVCSSAWELVKSRCIGRALNTQHWVVEDVAFAEPIKVSSPTTHAMPRSEYIEPYAAPALIQRLGDLPAHWPGEFRMVATAFVGFPELDPGSEEAVAQLQAAVECVQYETSRFGGTLERLSMDNKGVTLLAAFGVPTATFGNEPLRAVRTAMAIVDGLRSYGIACSVGVTWGRAFCCDSGGPRRRHIGLVSSAINLAARLMQAAAGSVLCDASIRSAADRWLCFVEQSPLCVKAQPKPLEVFAPGLRAFPEFSRLDTPIFGREAEKFLIDRRIESLIESRGGALTLAGEAGVGKSTLLAYAGERARTRGVRVLNGAASILESATPYFPWRHLLSQMLGGVGGGDGAGMAEAAMNRLANAPLLSNWSALLNDILPLGLPDNEITTGMVGEARIAALQALFIHLLREIALEQPVLLSLDDLQWFDESSAALLEGATSALPELLILAGRRLEPDILGNPSLSDFGALMTLDSLSREAMPAFLAHKLRVGEVPDALCEYVYRRTDGNPFFSEELVFALRDSRAITVEQGRCCLPQLLEASPGLASAPMNLHEIVLSRVDALPPAAQHLLKLASVIGRDFSIEDLRAVHQCDNTGEIEALLDSLRESDLLRRPADNPGGYAFKHTILQDVVYDLLPFAQRRDLHQRLALSIEHREAARLERAYALLALHWERAAQIQKALDYLEKAAQFSFENYANRETIAQLQRAVRLAREHGISQDRLRDSARYGLLGDAHHELSEYLVADDYFASCLDGVGRAIPKTSARICLHLLWQTLIQIRLRLGRKSLAPHRFQGQASINLASHVLWKCSEISYYQNRMFAAIYSILLAMNLAERYGAADGHALGLAAFGQIFALFGLDRLSRYYSRLSLAVSAERDTLYSRGYVYLVNVLQAVVICDWPAVARFEVLASQTFAEIGAAFRWQQTRACVYSLCAMRGEFSRAEAALREARAQAVGDLPWQIRCWMVFTEMSMALARGLPSAPFLEKLRQARVADLHISDKLRSLGLEAQALMQMAEPEAALQAADEALCLMRQGIPTMWSMGDGICAVVQVYSELALSAADDRERRRLHRKARRAARSMLVFARLVRVVRPLAALTMGRLESGAGRAGRARRWWGRALRDARRWQMPLEEAGALYELGCVEIDLDVKVAKLRHAQALLDQLGMRSLSIRCQEALNRTEIEISRGDSRGPIIRFGT